MPAVYLWKQNFIPSHHTTHLQYLPPLPGHFVHILLSVLIGCCSLSAELQSDFKYTSGFSVTGSLATQDGNKRCVDKERYIKL